MGAEGRPARIRKFSLSPANNVAYHALFRRLDECCRFPDLFRCTDFRRPCFNGKRGGRFSGVRSDGFRQSRAAASWSRGCARKRAVGSETRELGGKPTLFEAVSLRRRTPFLSRHGL